MPSMGFQRGQPKLMFLMAPLAALALLFPAAGLASGPPASKAIVRTAVEGSTATSQVQVPDNDLETVGLPKSVSSPILLKNQPVLTSRGKTEVAFIGGTWCPYCAPVNWSLQIALSKFGTFSQLGPARSSSSQDVFPGLRSWSFQGSHYSSSYFTLNAFEVPQSGLAPPPNLARLIKTYDKKPYTTTAGAIPFLDIYNRFLVIGAPIQASVLAHLTPAQIAKATRNPQSSVAKAIDGTANYLIAAFCSVAGTGSEPICASRPIAQLATKWAKASATTSTTVSSTTTTLPTTTTTTLPTGTATTSSTSTTTTTLP